MSKGKIVILSGPSGSGKTTLHQMLLASPCLKGRLVKSVSATTRKPRKNEKDGEDYFFLSRRMFLYKRRAGHFLESEKVFQDYYGTPRKNVEDLLISGRHVLLCIDVKGARTVAKKYLDAVKIFVKTPNMEELKKRLQNRKTETPETLALRLTIAQEELKEAGKYDFVLINDHLDQAYQRLERFVCERLLGRPVIV